MYRKPPSFFGCNSDARPGIVERLRISKSLFRQTCMYIMCIYVSHNICTCIYIYIHTYIYIYYLYLYYIYIYIYIHMRIFPFNIFFRGGNVIPYEDRWWANVGLETTCLFYNSYSCMMRKSMVTPIYLVNGVKQAMHK